MKHAHLLFSIAMGLVVLANSSVNSLAAVSEPLVINSAAATLPPVQVAEGQSSVISFSQAVERASVNDSAVADVVVVSPTQLLVHGRKSGSTSLIVWQQGSNQLITVVVEKDLNQLRETLKAVFPAEAIQVHSSSGVVVLSGEVSSPAVAEQALDLAKSVQASPLNLMQVKAQQVLIEVRFAEVNRSMTRALGVDYIFQKDNFTHSSFLAGNLNPQTPATPKFGRVVDPSDILLSSAATHLFEIREGIDISVALKALAEKGLIRILAEPNVLAMSGEKASFLAGGEFPIPVVQSATSSGGSTGAVTIEFKEFGIRLNFQPQVTGDGSIRLFVEPEVSVLDFATAAVKLNGFSIPGLVMRRASTTVQMRSGESLVIGGLLSQMDTRTDRNIPWLGDVPILGALFRSEQFKKEETELMVLVTPRLIQPEAAANPPALQGVAQAHQAINDLHTKPPYPDARGEAIRQAVSNTPPPATPEPAAPVEAAPEPQSNTDSSTQLFQEPPAPYVPAVTAKPAPILRKPRVPQAPAVAAQEEDSGWARNSAGQNFQPDRSSKGSASRHHQASGPLWTTGDSQ